MTNEQFFQFRVSNRIASKEIADWAGCTYKHMLNVETGREPVQEWMIKAVKELQK